MAGRCKIRSAKAEFLMPGDTAPRCEKSETRNQRSAPAAGAGVVGLSLVVGVEILPDMALASAARRVYSLLYVKRLDRAVARLAAGQARGWRPAPGADRRE